jgi:GNAT superfamily N-acetyltransferase
MAVSIHTDHNPTEADRAILVGQLVRFNQQAAGASGYAPIAVLLKSENDETVGGLWGKISYDWLFVELLVVPEYLRGGGVGSELMKAAERIALERGCVGVWLDTHGFQAPGFYKALGYELFGEIADHPRRSTRHFFRKTFG